MKFYFFLSYARANEYGEIEKFFDDLSRAIRVAKGIGKTETVGFLDKRGIGLGKEWRPEIINTLQKCPTLVCLYSPAYFKSEYCGKEWEIFRRRQCLYLQKRQNACEQKTVGMADVGQDRILPPVIKPVIWFPIKEKDIPSIVSDFQYRMNSHSLMYEMHGLEFLRRHYTDYSIEYDLFIKQLAEDILSASENYDLPGLESAPRLSEIPNPFSLEEPDLKGETVSGIDHPLSEGIPSIKSPVLRILLIVGILLTASILIARWIWVDGQSEYKLECGDESDYKDERIVQWAPVGLGWNIERIDGKQGRHIVGDKIGLFKTGASSNQFCAYRDFTLTLTIRFVNRTGIAWIVRAKDINNYYLFELCPHNSRCGEKKLNFFICEEGALTLIESHPVTANIDQGAFSFYITTEAEGGKFTHTINVGGESTTLGIFNDSRFQQGGIGFNPINGMDVLLEHFLVIPKLNRAQVGEP